MITRATRCVARTGDVEADANRLLQENANGDLQVCWVGRKVIPTDRGQKMYRAGELPVRIKAAELAGDYVRGI